MVPSGKHNRVCHLQSSIIHIGDAATLKVSDSSEKRSVRKMICGCFCCRLCNLALKFCSIFSISVVWYIPHSRPLPLLHVSISYFLRRCILCYESSLDLATFLFFCSMVLLWIFHPPPFPHSASSSLSMWCSLVFSVMAVNLLCSSHIYEYGFFLSVFSHHEVFIGPLFTVHRDKMCCC